MAFQLGVARDVAKGLKHMQSCGLSHQDVKPDNLLLFPVNKRAFVTKLGDLGLAAQISICTGCLLNPNTGGSAFQLTVPEATNPV